MSGAPKRPVKPTFYGPLIAIDNRISGAAGSRTLVQTNSPNAFYMLIPALIVGKQQEPDKPIVSLAVFPIAIGT
jgi:hypothetical protein